VRYAKPVFHYSVRATVYVEGGGSGSIAVVSPKKATSITAELALASPAFTCAITAS